MIGFVKRAMACVAILPIGVGFPAHGADIVWVHQKRGNDVGSWEEDQWRELIESNGHTIMVHDFFDDLDVFPDDLQIVNSGDLVIFSRDSNSGDYDDGSEIEAWTAGVTDPMIVMNPLVMRSNRWRMVDSTGTPVALNPLEALDPNHRLFEGVALDANHQVQVWDDTLLGPDDRINITDASNVGNGTVIAQEAVTANPWIIYWEAGVEFYDGAGTIAGGPRLFFGAGSADDPNTWGSKNTTAAGDRILLNAIRFLTGVDDPTPLRAGDANQDLEFNQLDLVQVQIAAKYLTGQAATWGEGDWDGAPGGEAGSPPAGNGVFDQRDIVAALAAGAYLTGPYGAEGRNFETSGSAPIALGSLGGDGELGAVDRIPVPEPSSIVLAIMGWIGLVTIGRVADLGGWRNRCRHSERGSDFPIFTADVIRRGNEKHQSLVYVANLATMRLLLATGGRNHGTDQRKPNDLGANRGWLCGPRERSRNHA